jgi:MFS family permease
MRARPPRTGTSGRRPDSPSRGTGDVIRSLIPSVYAPTLLEASGEKALMPVIPLMALGLGFNAAQAAALTVIFGIASVAGPIPAGRLMTRIGARPALVTTGTLLVIMNIVAVGVVGQGLRLGEHGDATGAHRGMFIALLVVMAGSSQVWSLGRQSYLGTALPSSMRARGMTLFGGMMRIGEVIGPILGAAVMALGHDSWVFVLFAILSASATFMVAVFMVPGEGHSGAPAEETGRPGAAGHPDPGRPTLPPSTVRPLLTKAVLRRMILVGLGITPVMMARVNRPVILPLLGAALGVDATAISIIFGISAVFDIALVVPAGILMDRYGRAAVAVPCSLVMSVGYTVMGILALTVAHLSPVAAVVALGAPSLLISMGNGLGSGIVMTLGIDVSPVHGRTHYLAWWNTMIGVGRLIAPLVVSGITLIAPIAVAGIVSGVLCLGGGVWLGKVLPRFTPPGRIARERAEPSGPA